MKDIFIGRTYKVKNNPVEFGKQFHWMLGMNVKVMGEKNGYSKYPIEYNRSLLPDDGVSTHAQSIRGDLLEEL